MLASVCADHVAVHGVRLWHIAAFRRAAKLVAYWTNNGQGSVLTLDGYAAIDPERTMSVRRSSACTVASIQHRLLAAQVHGRTIPLTEFDCKSNNWKRNSLLDLFCTKITAPAELHKD